MTTHERMTTYEKLNALQDSCDTPKQLAELHKDLIYKALSTYNDDIQIAIDEEFENIADENDEI